MTRTGRALLGATFGAALTLLIHPASRPYLFSSLLSPTDRTSPAQEEIPDNVVDLSDWMIAIGDKFASRNRITSLELENAISAASRGRRLDPKNAYWEQMLACLYHLRGDEAEAVTHWIAAAQLDTWNDYQSVQLLKERDRISREFGAKESWQLSYVYYQRNKKAVTLIAAYAHRLLATSPLDTREGLLMRTNNVLNGALLRQGSRSILIGNEGAKMSEDACQPPNATRFTTAKHHTLFLQRIKMQNDLRQLGSAELAERVHKIYNESDGWQALENSDDAKSVAAEFSYLGLLYVGLPSVLLVTGITGLCLWLLGHSLRRVERIQMMPASLAGVALALVAYLITLLPLAAIATFLCCAFLTLGPKRERRIRIDDLGPMFSFTISALALAFMVLFGAFVIGGGAPAVALLPFLEVPAEYFGGSGVLMGLAVIIIAITLLLAPLFATALRIGSGFVLSLALKKFGAFLGYVSLVGIVVATPICIYLDRNNSESLGRLVSSEPVYYLTLPR